MTDGEKRIYLRIRAEQIQNRHAQVNKCFFPDGYPFASALEIAEEQLSTDLNNDKLRITLDELLLLDDQECAELEEQRTCFIA